ncbi:terminase domain protein, partial [Escherichia coli PA9]
MRKADDTCMEHGMSGLGRAPEKGAVDYSGSDLSG